jgi:hypothetical protein
MMTIFARHQRAWATAQTAGKAPDRYTKVTELQVVRGYRSVFSAICEMVAEHRRRACFDGRLVQLKPVGGRMQRRQNRVTTRKITCEDCFFRRNLLCALDLDEPCATFRPNEAQLKPPQQLRFVFRQERRARAAWAFPSAQEQAALHT